MKLGESITIQKIKIKDNKQSSIESGTTYTGKLLKDISENREIRLSNGMNTSCVTKIIPTKNPAELLVETNTSVYKIINNEVLEKKEKLNENMYLVADFMERLDHLAEYFSIDTKTGKICFSSPNLPDIKNEKLKEYQRNFNHLTQAFKQENDNYVKKVIKQKGVLDAKNVMGTVVVVFNSAINKLDKFRGSYHHLSQNMNGKYLGLVHVDINPEMRNDGVSPSISLTHEMQHHIQAVMEYLMRKDDDIDFQSSKTSFRFTSNYKDKKGYWEQEAKEYDKEKYSLLLNRKLNKEDERNIRLQGRYLDELHSSFLQRKSNWFSKNNDIYSVYGKGKHWELVGENLDDINSTKKLLAYMQGFIMCAQLQEIWEQKKSSNKNHKIFIEDFKKKYRKAGSLIGVSKTVQQAEYFLAKEWEDLKNTYPKLFESNIWKKYNKKFEEAGIASPRLKEI